MFFSLLKRKHVVGMTLNTMPDIQHRDAEGNLIDNPKLALIGIKAEVSKNFDQLNIFVFPAEAVCISWFTIEYLLR